MSYFFGRMTVRQIALAGIFLALLILGKYLDYLTPQVGGYSIIEFYTVFALMIAVVLDWRTNIAIVIIAPFLFLAMGQVTIVNGWSMLLDYSLPIFFTIIIKFAKNYYFAGFWLIIYGGIKFMSHSLSGMLFYDTGFVDSMIFNAPLTWCTIAFGMITVVIFKQLRKLAHLGGVFFPEEIIHNLTGKNEKTRLIRFGYLNKVYKTHVNGEKYILRVPRLAKADWANEAKVYRAVFDNRCFIDASNGYLLKPFIEGETPKEWTPELLQSLDQKIQEFHNLRVDNVLPHDWNKWNKFASKVSSLEFEKYIQLVKKYENAPKVLSHNDINIENVLVNDNKITLIDFEWSRMNHGLFDYAQFYVTEGVHIKDSLQYNPEYKELIFMTLVFSILWTYSIKFNLKVVSLRKKYVKNLKAFNL